MRNFTMAVSRPETPAATEAVHAGLVVRDIRVSYGAVPAVRGVTLDCQPGQIIGVVGPNGAGKTSMLTGIAGIAPMLGGSVSGSVSLDGRDLTRWAGHRRGQAGIVYMAERRRVFPSLSVRENLEVGGWGLDKTEVKDRVENIYRIFPRLAERSGVPSYRLSGGEQRMLSIGRMLLSGAQCLLLDELSLGLAPRIVSELIGTIRSVAAEGRTVIVVEQYLGVLLQMADLIHVLQRGRFEFSGAGEEAQDWLEHHGFSVHAATAAARAQATNGSSWNAHVQETGGLK
jgi:branched-chain amino acid transport system ATP-binding protein